MGEQFFVWDFQAGSLKCETIWEGREEIRSADTCPWTFYAFFLHGTQTSGSKEPSLDLIGSKSPPKAPGWKNLDCFLAGMEEH